MKRRLLACVLAASLVAVLTACTAPADPATDGELRIVASTNVYGDVASTIAGPGAVVTSIIDDPSADPHGFEANPRVQLDLVRADLVIANGGGYDDFLDEMLAASGNTTAVVIHAVDVTRIDASANEHVWYDYSSMQDLVHEIAVALDGIEPDPERTSRAADLSAEIGDLLTRLVGIGLDHLGAGVIVTEPVPLYLVQNAALTNLTPEAFTDAIEEDTDVPPALLQDVLNLIPEASVVIVNDQTGGPQTDAVIDIAGENDVPWFGVSETLPEGETYQSWQAGILDLLEDALTR
jgi:zinc/manganese transport system substrate-binding protein